MIYTVLDVSFNNGPSKVFCINLIIWSWYTGRWWVDCYIWYSEEGTGRGPSPPRPLLAVPNATAHPSTASVPITVSLYNGPLRCGFSAHKGLKRSLFAYTALWSRRHHIAGDVTTRLVGDALCSRYDDVFRPTRPSPVHRTSSTERPLCRGDTSRLYTGTQKKHTDVETFHVFYCVAFLALVGY